MTEEHATLEVRASREFAAPIDDAFAAWTRPELVKQWWGPTGFTCPLAELDVRPGGVSLVAMRAPAEYGGGAIYNTWTYTLVDAPTRLEYVMRFATENGSATSPAEAGIPSGIPDGVPHVVTFKSVGDNRSSVTVVESGYTNRQARDMSQAGLDQCLDKLERLLSGPLANPDLDDVPFVPPEII